MIASYRVGVVIVAGTLGLSVLLCAAVASRHPAASTVPAAEDLSGLGRTLGAFRLIERSGRAVTDADLADRPWIAAFVFSRCRTSCPVISRKMKDIQTDLNGTGVTLASLSVDPDYDTPEVLRGFANLYGADPTRWLFLTGPKSEIYRLILVGFLQSVSETNPEDRREAVEAVSHSDRLVLVGPGNRVLGAYASNDPEALKRLTERARRLAPVSRVGKPEWVWGLPALNAGLNATCAVLLMIAWVFIRRGQVVAHAATMITALAVSALFLTSYLVYHYHVGSIPFRGVGPIRLTYLSILLSHTVLAIAAVPLIVLTLILAIRRRFVAHGRVARVTFPIWMYVSLTGVVVYAMLYHLPVTP